MKHQFSTKVGSYLIIQITGTVRSYIAEVIQDDPLIVKVTEEGPYAKLKVASGDFVILKSDTFQFQQDILNDTDFYLEHNTPISGLKSLGVTDDKLHEMLAG